MPTSAYELPTGSARACAEIREGSWAVFASGRPETARLAISQNAAVAALRKTRLESRFGGKFLGNQAGSGPFKIA